MSNVLAHSSPNRASLTGGELEDTRQATGKPTGLDSIAGFEPTSAIYHEGFPLRGFFFIDFLVT